MKILKLHYFIIWNNPKYSFINIKVIQTFISILCFNERICFFFSLVPSFSCTYYEYLLLNLKVNDNYISTSNGGVIVSYTFEMILDVS